MSVELSPDVIKDLAGKLGKPYEETRAILKSLEPVIETLDKQATSIFTRTPNRYDVAALVEVLLLSEESSETSMYQAILAATSFRLLQENDRLNQHVESLEAALEILSDKTYDSIKEDLGG